MQSVEAANLGSDSSTQTSSSTFRAWPVDAKGFSTDHVQALKHNFHQHPLMQLPALARLAKDLMPTQQCRFIKPGTTQTSAFDHAAESSDGRTIDEVFRRIEETGSWVALYNVQTDPAYKAFVDEVAASVRPFIEPGQPGIYEVGGFIFISAPPSVTPFHIDRENNCWLQVHGRKTMNVWEPTDRVAVSAADAEHFIVHGGLERVKLREEVRARSHEFDTGPGDGVYFPMLSPHMTRTNTAWVKPGDGVSISIGVVFYSSLTKRKAYGHAFNRIARRFGFNPQPPTGRSVGDRLRSWMGRAIVAIHKRTRGYVAPKGF
jgi:hypothetical protein